MTIKIYHNPRCSKSRETLALLEQNGVTPEIIEYLKDVPSVDDIKQLLTMLNFDSARQLIRTKETIYKDLALSTENDESKLIDAMVAHPKLIERPVVVNGDKAAVGRPPENVLAII
ncbi:arsenate reductase (glutaredoxin) [Pseudoalteromonas piratica]|uniref:Arsenate reductase n=1 Tax=Pseudoalteromonas piratica TaxID=1348114 RepID=A0A0A7EII3_9GAMM|nr:arsenate reductase (glutaredoxin) [Pseudoalteromonas piratica]AIY65777.1 arsenate reductase [Pseudoalteromonas piratica]